MNVKKLNLKNSYVEILPSVVSLRRCGRRHFRAVSVP